MKTIILPGRSLKNKAWAEEMADQMGVSDYKVIEWEPWKNDFDQPLDIDLETSKVLSAVGQEKVLILAKSIGTYITIKVLEKVPDQIEKILFCGIPLNFLGSFNSPEKSAYKILSDFPSDKILIFQNEKDTAGSFSEVNDFIKKISPAIQVISKSRDDHSYPYPEDFKNFLQR